MSKIFGDEFNVEIAKLKRLDRKILECKAHSEHIRYVCNTNPALNSIGVTIKDAIRSLLLLSKRVDVLRASLSEYDTMYKKIDSDIVERLTKNALDRENFKRIILLRKGAEELTETYSKTLKQFGKYFRDEID
tara:strand:- start:101 stop:499 length:399 start_codon:yes stop_codon:yes gene_type:complete